MLRSTGIGPANDVNGDGSLDLLIGAPEMPFEANPQGKKKGSRYRDYRFKQYPFGNLHEAGQGAG